MRILSINKNNKTIASVSSSKKELNSPQAALQLIININSTVGSNYLIVDKNVLADEFYTIENGIAEGVLAKFRDYKFKVAFYGDFSQIYAENKSFRIFAQENKDFAFVDSREAAIAKVSL